MCLVEVEGAPKVTHYDFKLLYWNFSATKYLKNGDYKSQLHLAHCIMCYARDEGMEGEYW